MASPALSEKHTDKDDESTLSGGSDGMEDQDDGSSSTSDDTDDQYDRSSNEIVDMVDLADGTGGQSNNAEPPTQVPLFTRDDASCFADHLIGQARIWFESLYDTIKTTYYDSKLKTGERYVGCLDLQPSFASDLIAYQEHLARMNNEVYHDIPD
ncbi:uncharacterized protein UTRI_05079 [Ustilago trichophora]|uniref:Uncharacterized protein n=1 Tax=Ustilago trichophora TaxID=86804 RepID=A0A5C3EE58_9BASI|nr:uncharacterized protein UTRI_05079 [Ustilago trichophora]